MWGLLFNFLGFLWAVLQVVILIILGGFFLGIGICIAVALFLKIEVEGE